MMPGARYARILMVIVAIIVAIGLVVGVAAMPGLP
jgi:phosphotransferase system  glucose/maltose/N-acetylglucosamine-specific IIC component